MIKVVKRDGAEEDFDINKISKVLVAAGLESQEATNIADSVLDWAEFSGTQKIKSTDIANEVVEMLKRVNTYVADLYIWYQQTKTLVKLGH